MQASEPDKTSRSLAGRWAPWLAVILMAYVLSFGPTAVRVDYSRDWNNPTYIRHRQIYAPVWWCVLHSETGFQIFGSYCEFCAKRMGYPALRWSWHSLRLEEGLEEEKKVI